jgi:hypothetical protein
MDADAALPVPQKPAPNGLRARLGRLLLAVWIPGLLVVLGALMTDHWVTLPRPEAGAVKLQQRLTAAMGDAAAGRWAIAHVLYGDCRCSGRVFAHLRESERPAGVAEIVLWVGAQDPALQAACEAKGMQWLALDQTALEQEFGIAAAPLFCVLDPAGSVVHVSGYTDRKQGLEFHDLRAIVGLRDGKKVAALPVYGCGVAASLQDVLDPLGLKY